MEKTHAAKTKPAPQEQRKDEKTRGGAEAHDSESVPPGTLAPFLLSALLRERDEPGTRDSTLLRALDRRGRPLRLGPTHDRISTVHLVHPEQIH